MNTSTNALNYRSFNLQHDLAALVLLLKEVEQVDQAGEDVSEDALREHLTWSGQDPALNNRVVALPDDDLLVGYGSIQKAPSDENADIYIAIHPAWRRQGIGGQFFAHILARAHELDARALRVYVNAHNEASNLFVRQQGFEPVSSYIRLSVSGRHSFPAPVLPPGFTMRSYDQLQRVDLYTEAMNRGYEGQWGHLTMTQEEVASWLPRLNHAGIFLLFAPDGAIVGTCRANLSTENGVTTALIDAPGIVPEYRNDNLALPLLLTTIHWLLRQQPKTLELEAWGDTPATIALYRSLGFSTMKEEISYRRDLRLHGG